MCDGIEFPNNIYSISDINGLTKLTLDNNNIKIMPNYCANASAITPCHQNPPNQLHQLIQICW